MRLSVMNIIDGTIVDGPGFRISVYAAGCSHKCTGCHNPQSWNMENGKQMDINDIFDIISNSPWNVTFSGGDPFFQATAFTVLAKRIKEETNKTIWCYTGYLYEEIIFGEYKKENLLELLKYIDVLVDGKFEQEQKDISLKFRGSSNQRFIDVKQSILKGEAVNFKIDFS